MVLPLKTQFHLIETPPYRVTAKYSVREDEGAVEVWRLIIEEFSPVLSDEGGAVVVSGWEKILRTKKTNTTEDLIEETIVRDAWRLRQGLREDIKERI